jgi:hypothetical protein
MVKRSLLQLAIDQQLNIVTLQTAGNSLEDIFRELTKSNDLQN